MRLTGFWRWCAFVLLVAALGYALIQPSNDRDWSPDQRVMPRASFRGQYVDVTGIRNAEYRSTDDFTVRHYDRTFNLDALNSVWFVVEPFHASVEGPAHTLMSFGFVDGAGDAETKIRVGDRVWHRTGDAGYFDDRQRLWLLGRCSARLDDSRGTLYPFAVEAAASNIDGVHRSAFVMHRERRTLVIEPSPHVAPVSRSTLLDRLEWAQLDDVMTVRVIPVDKRHNAKVDYPALQAMLARR